MMTNLESVSRSRKSTEDFLFSQTESQHPVEKPISESYSNREKLQEVFPDILFGPQFVEQALEQLSSAFKVSTVMVKMDELLNYLEKGSPEEFSLDVATAIDACCKDDGGIWGQVDIDRFGCFLPERTPTECLEVAQKIQQTIAARRTETVSIGIAGYPTINYPKDQIVENAQKAVDHAAFFGPNSIVVFDSVSLNISADKYYAQGDIPGAIEEFNRALLLDPSNINVHNSLGVCYGVVGDLDKALESFETTAWLAPEEFMALYNIGMISLLKEEKEKALEYFRSAYDLSEDVFEVAFQTGRLYLELDRAEEAKTYLEEAAMLQPTSAATHRYLGDCYASLGITERAIAEYKSAVKLNPNDASALSALGCLFDLEGENPEVSTAFCLQSVEISPDNGLYRHRLGCLYMNQNRDDEALKEFEIAEKLGYDSQRQVEELHNRSASDVSSEQTG